MVPRDEDLRNRHPAELLWARVVGMVEETTGGVESISAPDQTIGGQAYVFSGWSDGGAASHDILISGNATLTATFVRASP